MRRNGSAASPAVHNSYGFAIWATVIYQSLSARMALPCFATPLPPHASHPQLAAGILELGLAPRTALVKLLDTTFQ